MKTPTTQKPKRKQDRTAAGAVVLMAAAYYVVLADASKKYNPKLDGDDLDHYLLRTAKTVSYSTINEHLKDKTIYYHTLEHLSKIYRNAAAEKEVRNPKVFGQLNSILENLQDRGVIALDKNKKIIFLETGNNLKFEKEKHLVKEDNPFEDEERLQKFYNAIKDFLPKPLVIANANAAEALISLDEVEQAPTAPIAQPSFAELLTRIPSPVHPSGSPKRQLPTLDPNEDSEDSEQPSCLKKAWISYTSSFAI